MKKNYNVIYLYTLSIFLLICICFLIKNKEIKSIDNNIKFQTKINDSKYSSKSHNKNLIQNEKGHLISVEDFEIRLKLDSSFDRNSPFYKDQLFINYIRLAIDTNPNDILKVLKERVDWLSNANVSDAVITMIANNFGLKEVEFFLHRVSSIANKKNILSYLIQNSICRKKEILDFLVNCTPEVLNDKSIIQNMIAMHEGSIDEITEFYLKLPEGKNRTNSVFILAEKALSLNKEKFDIYYGKITKKLNSNEIAKFQSSLVNKLDNISDFRLKNIFNDGFKGDLNQLKMLGERHANLSVDEAINSLTTLKNNKQFRSIITEGIAKSWAEYDPTSAMQYTYNSYKIGDINSLAMKAVISSWNERDTTEAVNYYKRLDLDSNTEIAIDQQELTNIASNSISTAISLIENRSEENDISQDMVDDLRMHLVYSHASQYSTNEIVSELNKIEDRDSRLAAYYKLSSSISTGDLQKAVRLAAETTIPEYRDSIIRGSLHSAYNHNMNYSYELINQISDPSLRIKSYKEWYDVSLVRDYDAAVSWKNSLKKTNHELYNEIIK